MTQPEPRNVETEISASTRLIAAEAGFDEPFDLPDLGGDVRWCFQRRNPTLFTVEAICFLYQREPGPLLFTHWLVSDRDVPSLTENGVSGNALLEHLFHFQIFRKGRSPNAVLPQAIEISEWSDLDAMLVRLREEVLETSGDMAEIEFQRWRKRG